VVDQILQTQPAPQPTASAPAKKKLSMLVMSGDIDKICGAFILATGAAASNAEVTMFFNFWGLRAIKRGTPTGKSMTGKLMGWMTRGDIERADTTRYRVAGMGRRMFKKLMRDHNIASLTELRQLALDLGVVLYGCTLSMDVMEVAREDLIDDITDCVGVGFFMNEALNSDVCLFIG
jgi:peroxiredoxin family protein